MTGGLCDTANVACGWSSLVVGSNIAVVNMIIQLILKWIVQDDVGSNI